MKTAFFVRDWEEEYLRKNYPDGQFDIFPGKLTADLVPKIKDYEIISIFVDSNIDKATIDGLPNLKLISTRSTGYDHLDLADLKARGIAATYVPGYGDDTVAEFAMGLLLNITRKINFAANRVKQSSFSEAFSQENLEGVDLKGRTAGVIGTGRIGKEFIKMAKGFGMNVVGFDAFPDVPAAAALGYAYVSLEDLLKQADAISIHCIYNETTHHLLNSKNLPLMKKGSYLVNTARGPVVETAALLQALKDGTLAAAGLDVIEEEQYFKNGKTGQPENPETAKQIEELLAMQNVLITPHVAFDSREAHQRILNITIDNIRSFIAGTPKNMVPMP